MTRCSCPPLGVGEQRRVAGPCLARDPAATPCNPTRPPQGPRSLVAPCWEAGQVYREARWFLARVNCLSPSVRSSRLPVPLRTPLYLPLYSRTL